MAHARPLRPRRHGARASAAALLLALAGCAAYRPAPLPDSQLALAPPVAAVMSTQAEHIDRPWLHPATIDLARPLDANAIGVLAVLANPDLKAQRAAAGISAAQAFAARLLPDPNLSFSYDRLLSGPDSLDNFAGQIAQDIGLLRERKVIAAAGRAQNRQVRLDIAWAEWQTAGAARLQAVRVAALETQVTLARSSDTSARAMLASSLGASLRGDIAGDAVQANRLAALDAAERLRAAETALAAARQELARLLGLPPGSRLQLADTAPAVPAELDPARLFALAERNRTDLAALRAGYAAQEAAVHKAVLDQFPTLQLGFGASRDTTGNQLLGSSVNFTLPLWNRNRGGIAIETATRASLQAAYVARLAQTRADIAAAIDGIALARHTASDLQSQIAALSAYAMGASRAAAHGDLAATTALLARQSLLDRQSQLSAANQALGEQMIALELLTGTPISSWNQTS
ncbi:MAG TPA: TolC family protein [Novosphingobium sp.]|nr:TolC family protein [Novosphingobium sp.]